MIVKEGVKLNGNNIATDSFNSTNALYSTSGKYDPAKARDHGDIASVSGLSDAVNTGNADIKGYLSTGPGGSVDVGKRGSVGDKAWVEGGNLGLQPGHVSNDMNMEFVDVDLPSGTPTTVYPGSYLVGSSLTGFTNYNYVLTGYPTGQPLYLKSSNLSGKVYVTGHVALLVSDTFNFGSSDYIYLAPGAELTVYVAAPTAALSGVLNPGSALNFQYYGLNSNASLSFSGNAAFTGCIYAPYADFKLGGGGNNTYDFVGASVTKSVIMGGHYNFHYDEASATGPWKGYIVVSWNEINPNS